MIGATVRSRLDVQRILRAKQRAHIKNLGHAGGAIRLTARRSIRRRKSPSAPGKPPSTRDGQLKRALAYKVEATQQRVLIGPQYSVVGQSGKAHEFGGQYRREVYPKRPFMGPALETIRPRLPRMWAGSIR